MAGCAGGPLGEAPALGPARLGEGEVEGAASLALSRWAPDGAPRAVALAVHGYGDYGPSAFDGAARAWAKRGILTYAYDQRGFGRNASRARWPGNEALIGDLASVFRAVRAAHPDLPVHVVGHSMGGGVALAAAGEKRLPGADGLILAGPAVWGGAELPPIYRWMAWAGALLAPDARWTGDGLVEIQASDNIAALRALADDPLYLAAPSSRELLGLIRVMDRAAQAAPRVEAPVLTLYGARDEIAPASAVRAVHDAIPATKRLVVYPEGWHLLFRDLQAARVWADAADWMLAGP